MAIIDYKCEACGEKFFEIVKASNRDEIVCPKCKSKNVKQLFEGKCNSGGATKGGSCSGGSCSGCSGCH